MGYPSAGDKKSRRSGDPLRKERVKTRLARPGLAGSGIENPIVYCRSETMLLGKTMQHREQMPIFGLVCANEGSRIPSGRPSAPGPLRHRLRNTAPSCQPIAGKQTRRDPSSCSSQRPSMSSARRGHRATGNEASAAAWPLAGMTMSTSSAMRISPSRISLENSRASSQRQQGRRW